MAAAPGQNPITGLIPIVAMGVWPDPFVDRIASSVLELPGVDQVGSALANLPIVRG